MTRKRYLVIPFLVLTLFVGACSRNTTAVKNSSARVKASASSQRAANQDLDDLSKKSAEAARNQEIDESTDEEIQEYVARERAKVEAHILKLEEANNKLEAYKTGNEEYQEQEVVEAANAAASEASKNLRILEEKTKVIVDFLNSETFSKAEIGALFDPGQYILPSGRAREGKRLFRPIVQKLYVFADKYKDTFKSLKGNIIVTGYSDGTQIVQGSNLYKTLSPVAQSSYGIENPSSEQLNLVLSDLRAEAVSELLKDIISEEKSKQHAAINIGVRTLGRGETIPPGVPSNAVINDSRRRVVTFYWVVLPEL